MRAAIDLVSKAMYHKKSIVLRCLSIACSRMIKDRTSPRNRAQTQGIAILKCQTKARLVPAERQI